MGRFMKVCGDCKEEKSFSEFYKSSKSADGYVSTCSECFDHYKASGVRRVKHMVKHDDVKRFLQESLDKNEVFKCKTCLVEKPADGFYTKRDYGKVYLVKNRCKECERSHQVFKKFGISKADYDKMLESQGRSCAICRVSVEDYKLQGYRDNFTVDHCHSSGVVRGLLCDKCNRGLGFFDDNPEQLLAAAAYLRK